MTCRPLEELQLTSSPLRDTLAWPLEQQVTVGNYFNQYDDGRFVTVPMKRAGTLESLFIVESDKAFF